MNDREFNLTSAEKKAIQLLQNGMSGKQAAYTLGLTQQGFWNRIYRAMDRNALGGYQELLSGAVCHE